MYELTSSEAATILSVLSRRSGREGSEVELHGLPSSTYYAARRKIYSSGWLSDRFVPNPWGIGVSSVNFVVATPGPLERPKLESELVASPSTVLLWAGVNALFAVSFGTPADSPQRTDGGATSVLPDSGSIPVYFDYSRAWSRFVGIERDTGYPRALGRAVPAVERTPIRTVAEALATGESEADQNPRAHQWHSPGTFSRSSQRLIEREVIESRTVLNVDRLPPYEGRALGEIVFLTGGPREGVTPTKLLGTLHNECNVSPILFAEDGDSLLIVALGQLATGTARRSKIPRATGHVSSTLGAAIQDLRMVVERSDSVRIVVNHRYDRGLPDVLESKPADVPTVK